MKITTKFNLDDVVYFVDNNKLYKGKITAVHSTVAKFTTGGLVIRKKYGGYYESNRKQKDSPTYVGYDIQVENKFKPINGIGSSIEYFTIPNISENRLYLTKEELLNNFTEDCK